MVKNVAAGEHGTVEEVEKAIRDLSDADLLRLEQVANFRARRLAALGLGIEARDLLQEAIMRTVAGERRWRVTVSFKKHLIETMRSMSSHACERLHGATVVSASTDDALDDISLTAGPCGGRELAAIHEQLALIAARFADDDEVSRVLAGLAEDKTGPDIQRDLGISATEYATIMRRLRRGLNRRSGCRS